MKVVFLHFGRENLGVEYLSSVLKKERYKTNLIFDAGIFSQADPVFHIPLIEKFFKKNEEKIVKEIITKGFDMVAFSVYTDTYAWAKRIAKQVKERSNTKILFGGIHPTLVPEKVMENSFIDFVIVGEGEYALLELVNKLKDNKDLTTIKNLWLRKNGVVIKNKIRKPLENLDLLPFPDKELFEKEIRFKDDYMIMTSRGCIFNCNYCCESYKNKLYNNNFFRRRSVESVIEELIFMKNKYNYQEVMFYDPIFLNDKKWLKELLIKYKKKIKVRFKCEGHIKFIDEEVVKLLKYANCYCIEFGIQVLNENLRKLLNREEKNFEIKKALKICDKVGLKYDIDYILGLPYETEKDYKDGTLFFSQLKHLNRIKYHNLTYFPRTKIIELAKNTGKINSKDILNIEDGKIGDFFHIDSIKNKQNKKVKQNFEKLFRILPVMPRLLSRLILKLKIYKFFRFLPTPFIIFLQLFVAIKGKDYRFIIYIKSYLHHFKLRILRCFKNV